VHSHVPQQQLVQQHVYHLGLMFSPQQHVTLEHQFMLMEQLVPKLLVMPLLQHQVQVLAHNLTETIWVFVLLIQLVQQPVTVLSQQQELVQQQLFQQQQDNYISQQPQQF